MKYKVHTNLKPFVVASRDPHTHTISRIEARDYVDAVQHELSKYSYDEGYATWVEVYVATPEGLGDDPDFADIADKAVHFYRAPPETFDTSGKVGV